nr:ATP-binding protein [Rubricella aquisinus]
MQAVGQLAGGVAHDFNNLLTAISGHCDLLLMRHRVGDSDYSDLMQVRENTNRAAALVRQLLAFSRKQTLQPTQLDLWDTLGDLSHLLNRLIGANVTLDIRKGEDIPTVRVDERQFEQVVMNLVVNARDAMPDGGLITLNARGRTLVNPLRRDKVTVPAGDYALIEVKDTGQGIAPDDLRKIFEPFFTTKGPGRGTGLGLSTVYGIVKQSGGYVFVDSHLGEGTTFSLYLPAVVKTAPELVPRAPVIEPSRDVTGRGVILLVEDEVPVRTFAKRALEMRGYEVIEAGTGEDALELLKASVELHPDIVLSDVVMPGMDGPSWVREADTRLDGARVIFMSGYAEDAFDGTDHPGSAYLAKPFSLNQLVLTVKEQLERVD